MLKLNRVLYGHSTQSLHGAIKPTPKQQRELEDARDIIREYLRGEIERATVAELGLSRPVTPKFRTQGSWKYGTCVQPAWPNSQQIDWDFGVYLPVALWESNGPPHEMAKRYFTLVDSRLAVLCEQKKWNLVSGKQTCSRVEISRTAHIDLPLYAAPEKELLAIDEQIRKSAMTRGDSRATFDSVAHQDWTDLKEIVFAKRSGEWQKSDPQKVARWFQDRISEHGESLRRVCMYLKAWRDFYWPGGDGPSSVCLMVAAAQRFVSFSGRDDLALEHVAGALARELAGEIRCDGIDRGAEDFNSRLNEVERRAAAQKAMALASAIQGARRLLSNTFSCQQAIQILIGQFGERVPNQIDLIEVDGGDEIRTTAAREVPPPIVRPTKAG